MTLVKPYRRWEFDMENSNMTGHWTGIFTAKGDETEIDFTEQVKAKKWLLKPFVKSYLRKQQTQFVADIMKIFHKDLYIGRRFVMKKYEYMTVDLSAEPSLMFILSWIGILRNSTNMETGLAFDFRN